MLHKALVAFLLSQNTILCLKLIVEQKYSDLDIYLSFNYYKNIFIKNIRNHICTCSAMSESLQPHGLQPTRFFCPWDFSGKNTGVACYFPPLGDLSDPEIKPMTLSFPSLLAHPLPLCHHHHLKDSHNRDQIWTHQKILVEI